VYLQDMCWLKIKLHTQKRNVFQNTVVIFKQKVLPSSFGNDEFI